MQIPRSKTPADAPFAPASEPSDPTVARYRREVALTPHSPEPLCRLAIAHFQLSQFEEAFACAQRALALDAEHVQATALCAAALGSLGRHEESLVLFEKLTQRQPDNANFWGNLGLAQAHSGDPRAEDSFRTVIALQPDNLLGWNMLGCCLSRRNQLEEAIVLFKNSLNRDPNNADTRLLLAGSLLKLGQCAEGWPLYEARQLASQAPGRMFPVRPWDGRPMPGKTLLVHAERGLGDTLQFVRYLPLVKAASGAQLLFECQPALLALLREAPGCDGIVPQAADLSAPQAAYDAHVPLQSLPFHFHTELETIPSTAGALSVEPNLTQAWKERLAGYPGLKVGLCWSGNPRYLDDRWRSCHLSDLAPLATVEGVTFFNVHKGPRVSEATAPPAGMNLVDLSSELDDFTVTAAVMRNLDLTISTCTSPAHLAGTLGTPVWIALAFSADWRWLMEREDSPWYPSARLFRQSNSGDWQGVFARMAEALRAYPPAASGRE